LVELGYRRVNKIDQSLEFASRGDILDIFSVNETIPIRIEFFDDEIEAIKEFDIQPNPPPKKWTRSISFLPVTFISPTKKWLLLPIGSKNGSRKIAKLSLRIRPTSQRKRFTGPRGFRVPEL
jgi:transcription-repair coupling factor (superfamily II helicase)